MASIAWRNLWRNPRRTWLSALAIAFAVLLLDFFMALQTGQYATMIDSATTLLQGHVQVQHEGYDEEKHFEDTVTDAHRWVHRIETLPEVVAVAPRVQSFVLVSHGESSFATELMGVETAVEPELSRLPAMIDEGRYMNTGDEGIIGVALARNLGVGVGDEITLLGAAKEGGVAALVVTVSGVFDSGLSELDRALVQVPFETFREAFALEDEAHALVVRLRDVSRSDETIAAMEGLLPPELVVLGWRELVPGLEQFIDLDRTSGYFFYVLLAVMVTLSIVNTFIMTVFERTREFGMLMALGLRPRSLVGLLQLETFCLVGIGVLIGLAGAVALIGWLARVGFPLPDAAAGLFEGLHLPSRMFPALDTASLVTGASVMFVSVQLAALVPALRLRRLVPVVALRAQ